MATYEYKCAKCGDVFEATQKMSDAPLEKCPKCDGPVERLISGGTGLIFKGSGFYITDYKKAGGKEKSDKESPKKETKDKTDSKPKLSTESSPPKNKPSD
jgi:putative FmdB family regulatory protein